MSTTNPLPCNSPGHSVQHPERIRGFIFDLDNTLYEWADADIQGIRASHKCFSREIEPLEWHEFHDLYQACRLENQRLLPAQGASHNRLLFFKQMVEKRTPEPRISAILELNLSYESAFLDHMRPSPHAEKTLSHFKDHGFALALATNSTARLQLMKICSLGLERFFSVVVTSEEVGVEKPDPRIFHTVAARMKLRPEELLMIGDHRDGDFAGARAAGMQALITREYHPEHTDTAGTIDNLGRLTSWFPCGQSSAYIQIQA